MPQPTLAIIGAGFSALSILTQLVDQQAPLACIHLFGSAEEFATGVAYGPASGESLLNTRAADLGLTPERPGDFADWAHLVGSARDDFLPRARYGEYLRAALPALQARSRFPIECHVSPVGRLDRDDDGFVLTAGAATWRADAVVLAMGALPAAPLAMIDTSLSNSPRYCDDPWHAAWLEGLAPDASVAILGTGLSMVDHVQRLRARGHRRPITAISRHGLLPRPHPQQRPAPEPLPEAVQRAIDRHSVRAVFAALRASCAGRSDWQPAFDSIRPKIAETWLALPAAERSRFLRHARSYWEVHRHRIAPVLHAQVQQWLASGALRIQSAHLLNAKAVGNGVELQVRPRGSDAIQIVRVDRFLRATGIDGPLRAGVTPLLDSLLEARLVHPDPLGLGIAVDAGQRVLDADGAPVPGLYALGTLARGRAWESTAIPELRVLARGIAQAVLATPG